MYKKNNPVGFNFEGGSNCQILTKTPTFFYFNCCNIHIPYIRVVAFDLKREKQIEMRIKSSLWSYSVNEIIEVLFINYFFVQWLLSLMQRVFYFIIIFFKNMSLAIFL